MAEGRFTDYGERFLLAILAGWPVTQGWALRLFTSPTADPADDDQDEYDPAFTEAAYTGYAPHGFNFGPPYLLSTDAGASARQYASTSTTLGVFRHNGDGVDDTDETVYGWYVTTANNGIGEYAWVDNTLPVYYRFFDTEVEFTAFMNPVMILPAWKLFGEEDIPA